MKYALSNVVGDPFWLTTMPMALVGWVVALVGSILNNSLDPSHFPVFSWWGIAFEMIAMLLTLHIALSDRVRQYKQAALAFLSIATIYTTNSTNNFVWRNNSSSGAAAAGYILLSIINFVWIMYLGTTSDELVHRYVDSFATEKKPLRPYLFDHRMNSARRAGAGRNLPDVRNGGHGRHPGTSSQPYRMSDVPQNISVGDPVGFSRTTDPGNPAAGFGSHSALSSTFLYSQDQLQRHGLNSYEYDPSARNLRHTMRSSLNQDGTSMLDRLSAEFRDDDPRDLRDDDLPQSPVAKAVARHAYEGNKSEGEFSFKHGDVLEVFDMEGNWWYCKAANGDEGICPSNYLELLPVATPQLSETTQPLDSQNRTDERLIDSW